MTINKPTKHQHAMCCHAYDAYLQAVWAAYEFCDSENIDPSYLMGMITADAFEAIIAEAPPEKRSAYETLEVYKQIICTAHEAWRLTNLIPEIAMDAEFDTTIAFNKLMQEGGDVDEP